MRARTEANGNGPDEDGELPGLFRTLHTQGGTMSADRRRSNGEGTEITKDKHGRYHASLSFGVKTGGRRDRRHVSGASRREVAEKLRALQAKRDAGVVPTAGTAPTLAVWLRHWLDTIAATKLRPGTSMTTAPTSNTGSSPPSGTSASTVCNPRTSRRSMPSR